MARPAEKPSQRFTPRRPSREQEHDVYTEKGTRKKITVRAATEIKAAAATRSENIWLPLHIRYANFSTVISLPRALAFALNFRISSILRILYQLETRERELSSKGSKNS